MICWGSPSNQPSITLEPHPLLELLLKVNPPTITLISSPSSLPLPLSPFPVTLSVHALSSLSPSAVVEEAKGSEELADGIGREVHQGVKERLQSDPDYNSEQFPSAEKVFQPNQ